MPLWAIKLGALAALALGLFGAGAYTHMRWADAKAAKAALMASEQARKDEHENAVSTLRKLDTFHATEAENSRRALAARSDLDGLRNSLAAIASAAPASACGADSRLPGIAQLLAEGAELAAEGADHVDRLRDQRDALSRP